MVTLRPVTEEEARWADEVDQAYEELEEPTEEVVSDQEATLSTRLRNPFFELMDIKLHLDQILLWEKTGISKGVEEEVEVEHTTSGIKRLKVEFQTETANISYEGRAAIKPGPNDLIIQFWDNEYPPKLILNGSVINKSIGPRYRRVGELPSGLNEVQRYGLYVRDADEHLGREFELTEEGLVSKINLIEIWIDDEKVDPLNPTTRDFTVPIRHQAMLTPGKHRVKVGSPVLHTVLFDGDIIFNGIDINELTVHTCKTFSDPCKITIEKRYEVMFVGSYKDLEHTERFTPKEHSILWDSGVASKEGI